MDKKPDSNNQGCLIAFIIAIALLLFVSCMGNSSSSSSTSSSSSYKSSSSSSSSYKSGKGSEWDDEVNAIADEYDMDPKEIDAMMRAIEQGQ